MRRTAVVLALACLLVTACGDGDDPVATGARRSTTTSSSSTTSSTVPTTGTTAGGGSGGGTTGGSTGGSTSDPGLPAGTATIRIVVGGGFVPYGHDFRSVPTVVLADGTSFTGGAMTMQFPGPPVAPVATGRLSSAHVQALLQLAKEADLDEGGRDFGQPGVTDMPSTQITVVLDGRAHTTSVYALGYDDPGASGLTPAQREARAQVDGFVTAVGEAVSKAATSTYAPTAYQVLAIPTEPAARATEDPKPNELDWPIAAKPLAQGSCIDLTGGDARTFGTSLERATSITVWRSGGGHWQLATRATLPGDAPCGAAG